MDDKQIQMIYPTLERIETDVHFLTLLLIIRIINSFT